MKPSSLLRPGAESELKAALARCRSAFVGVAILSGLLNVLYLTGSFFMLEVYDRVLPSRSVPTLVGLCVIALVLYIFQGGMDALRSRILTRIGSALDEDLSARAFRVSTRLPLLGAGSDSAQPTRDLDTVRGFLGGAGPTALFDLPWLPLYLAICFAFHPLIGLTALAGGVVLVMLTLLTERLTRDPVARSSRLNQKRQVMADALRRNAEAMRALGMETRLSRHWDASNAELRTVQTGASDVGAALGAFSKTFRMALQSAVLAVGAWLVVHQEASAGIIIAGSILSARALAPIDLAIAHWKGFVSARQSWARLSDILGLVPAASAHLPLPAPTGEIVADGVVVVPPGSPKAAVRGVSFRLEAGQGLGVIGPSASGKSSLVRALVGVWAPERGTVRLDGASLEQWSPDTLGAHVGYLPQDVQLFSGTIAENIARFDPELKPDMVIEASQTAGVHELILGLADGYETQIGDGGSALSAGQRQRIGLARALYGRPFLVVLDEPNSNLDGAGEEALSGAIMSVRLRGGIAVVVAHRPSALTALNLVMVMQDGHLVKFGAKEEVLGTPIARPTPVPESAPQAGWPHPAPATPLRPVVSSSSMPGAA